MSHTISKMRFVMPPVNLFFFRIRTMSGYRVRSIRCKRSCKVADASLHIIHDSYFKLNGLRTGILRNLIRNSFLGSCMAFRRELLDKALPCPRHSVPHDIWLGLLASYYGKVSYLPVPLMIYRRHEATVSASCDKSFFPFWFKIHYRVHCLTAFLKRISVR